jgi:hypothetical protein
MCLYQVSERSCICVLGVGKVSGRSCICVLGVGKVSERSCICVLGVSDLALSTTVKPVYKGHSRKPENMPFIYRL